MQVILLKLAIEVVAAILKCIGEVAWHNAQRYILPVIYGIAVSFYSGCWWLGITTLPMIGAIDIGYKDYGKNDAVDRAMWLFIICVISGLGPTLTGHMPWYVYVPFCVLSGFIGELTRNINNLIESPITGMWIVLPIWFIHP